MYKEDYDRNRFDNKDGECVYSKPVRAGKRTYFFDVKATKGRKDYFLTITESKRRTNSDGSYTYDKHKIFLYKEDFEKFAEGLNDIIAYIKDKCFDGEIPQSANNGNLDIEFMLLYQNLKSVKTKTNPFTEHRTHSPI